VGTIIAEYSRVAGTGDGAGNTDTSWTSMLVADNGLQRIMMETPHRRAPYCLQVLLPSEIEQPHDFRQEQMLPEKRL